ncbi:MAG: hypothetical protein FWF28_03780 [Micrococcales bacterium]|nr:hypothetical protein [Micrococcales bacterium]
MAFTLYVNDLLDRDGRVGHVIHWAASFPGRLGNNEEFLTQAPFQMMEFTALEWVQRGGSGGFSPVVPVVAGRTADAYVIGSAIGTVIGRKRQQQAETPQWRVIDAGQVIVSTSGCYFQTNSQLIPWGWGSIESGDLVGPGQFILNAQLDNGPVRYILVSDMAELVFTLWARARHPNHPQFTSGSWIPSDWAARMAAAGQPINRLTGRWAAVAPATAAQITP